MSKSGTSLYKSVVLSILAALVISGCTTSASSRYFGKTSAPKDNVLRYISGSEPETLDPQVPDGQPEARVLMKTNGKWSKMPGDNNASIPNLRDSFTEEGLKTLSDVKFDGNETVDGKPALVYSYKNVTPKGNYPFSSKIWIGADTGLPMKIEVNYDNGVLKQMTVNYDTESKVTIESPIS